MPWPSSSAARRRDAAPSLPPGFSPISAILDEMVPRGSLTNVIAIVKDCRLPMKTAGTDYKATMNLYDISTQDREGIGFSIFRPREEDIPAVNAADVVVLYQVKVQRWGGNPTSLITHARSAILVYSAAKIPRYPLSAKPALQPRAGQSNVKDPTDAENKYVSYFYREVDKGAVPDQEEFQSMAIQSLNVKQKFSLLQDVSEGKFCDLVVHICREPFDLGDKITLYVSDYTENNNFFNYTWEGVQDLDSGNGDVYGYTSNKDSDPLKRWVGPYGKKAMQVTCWEPHASYIRSEVEAGDWVNLRNVQIKVGHDGANLEGAMREERGRAQSDRVNVVVLDTDRADNIDPKLMDALRRWRDYMKAKKNDIKRLEASEGKNKRKADDSEGPTKENSKAKRKRLREEAQRKIEENEAKLKEEVLGLNPAIVCESADRRVTHLSSILEQQFHQTTIEGQQIQLPLPFICANYCVNARVVDFRPQRLEDFARSRARTDFRYLNNDSSDENLSDSGEDDSDDTGRQIWEWRFLLQLEDVAPKAKERQRVWVVVNNAEAQCLTDLDATNLRKDAITLATLREKLFTLWGELEEQKQEQLVKEARARKRKPGAAPPPTMSDDEDGNRSRAPAAPTVSNKPFTCCIRQYGIKMRESDPGAMDAGERKRWQRMFGLFGTRICS